MDSMCVSLCKCWVLVSGVHPVAILSTVFFQYYLFRLVFPHVVVYLYF